MKRLLRPHPRSSSAGRSLALAAALLWAAHPPLAAAPPAAPPAADPPKAAKAAKAARQPSRASIVISSADSEVPVYSEAACVALAAQQNPDVLAAYKRVESARAAITVAQSQVYPSLTASGYYQRRDQSIANGGTVTSSVNSSGQVVVTESNFNRPDDYYGDLRVSQNVYSGGAVRNRIAAAKLQAQAAGYDYQAQIDATTLAVRAAYYNVLYAEASIGVNQQAVDLLASQVKDQQDRLAAGSVGLINVNRSQVALANERPALLNSQAAVETAYAVLAQSLGVSYVAGGFKAPFRVRGALEVRPVSMTLAECLERARAKRPEVQSRLLAIDALKRQIVVEKSATRPQVTAYAAYDIYSEPDIRTVDSSYSGYTLAVTASWTLFDGFATRGRVRAVQAQVGEAEAQLAATRRQVESDVYTAYNDLRTAEASLKPLAENTQLASESLDLATRNFDAGLNSQLDVLQARVDFTRIRSGELAGRLSYNTALARLERAMSLGRPAQGSATAMPPLPK